MAYLYELGVLGSPSPNLRGELQAAVSEAIGLFGLRLGVEVGWSDNPDRFEPEQQTSAAAVYLGGPEPSLANLPALLRTAVPVLPVVPAPGRIADLLPECLHPLNCLAYSDCGPIRIATALLECVGLLPRQRRVFISYRRDEARQAAIQLFDALSARLFDVFLDTHGIAPAEDFQAILWHRLCDSDVLVMLDTPTYFESRWTNAEFGRALAKGISVLRIGWPDSTPSARTATAARAEILPDELDPDTGELSEGAVQRIWLQLEQVRSQSQAVRTLNMVSGLRHAIESIGGSVAGVGIQKAIYIQLPDGSNAVVYPTVGVPTSITLHEAAMNTPDSSVAIVYDSVGLHPRWLNHLEWLGQHVRVARWVKAHEAAWAFADWRGQQ